MKFCMVSTFYPPYSFGGDAIYLWRLTNALARRGHTVEVVHCADAYHLLSRAGPTGTFPNEPGVTVHTLHSKAGLLSPLVTQQTGQPGLKERALREIIERGQFDVLHFHNMSLIGLAALTYGPSSAVRLYTTHEHWLICPMHALWKYNSRVCDKPDCVACQVVSRRPPQLWRYTPLLGRWLQHVDAFIAPSRFTLRMHQERGHAWGLPELPFHHIPYFVPADTPGQETASSLTAAPLLPKERPYFLFVGRLERIKGVQCLIEVFRHYDKADLVVVGDGDAGDDLKSQAASLQHVHFLGRLPNNELRGLYQGALATLVPSICFEVFGIVIIEAFARRSPVIVHDLGALPEVVEESGGGLTYRTEYELIEAMERLRLDEALRGRLGSAGYAAYQRIWSEEAHLEAYFGLLKEIMEGRRLAPKGEPCTPQSSRVALGRA